MLQKCTYIRVHFAFIFLLFKIALYCILAVEIQNHEIAQTNFLIFAKCPTVLCSATLLLICFFVTVQKKFVNYEYIGTCNFVVV
jgi:hypothetical protein